MSTFKCTCGVNPEHSTPAQCSENRHVTSLMQKRINFPERIPEVRDAQGKFVRFPEGDEFLLPDGSVVEGGVIRR